MFYLPDLPYAYDALGKYISKDIMELHHQKHHQTYVNNLNKALEEYPDLQNKTLEELIGNLNDIPEKIRTTVKNHGGGHYNHSHFWLFMAPDFDSQPAGQLSDQINLKYGTFQNFIDQFSAKALSIFGSGWAWLLSDLSIETTANQDNPLMFNKSAPILGLDVWEHAYYLDYQANRADYIKAWWHVVNWPEIEKRYENN